MTDFSIEFGVRPVTRYIVTKHRTRTDGSTQTSECCEVDSVVKANDLAEALAAAEPHDPKHIKVNRLNEAPGRVMRFKVSLSSRTVNLAGVRDEQGRWPGRTGHSGPPNNHTFPDPQDPANWRGDGERLTFHAVAKGFDKDGNNKAAENRIFGYWSPSFDLSTVVRNDDVLANLGEPGEEFYVDFIRAAPAA